MDNNCSYTVFIASLCIDYVRMLIGEAIFISLLSGIAVSTGKAIVDYIGGLDCCIRLRCRCTLAGDDIDDSILVGESHFVPYQSAVEQLKTKLMNRRGGVYVVAGPPGSGKSTYLMKAIEAAKAECGASLKFMYFGVGETLGLLTNFGLHNRIGIPRDRPLSKYLSVGTVIIIDQLEINVLLDEKTRSYIRGLATDSRNSNRYSVMMCVSNYCVYKEILQLNGGEKISAVFPNPLSLQWSEAQMTLFISKTLLCWTLEDQKELVALCLPSHSPGIIGDVVATITEQGLSSFGSIDEIIAADINKRVNKIANDWSLFARRGNEVQEQL